MNVLPRTNAGRIALAIVLSLLAHAIALFVPLVEFPFRQTPPPPIMARLEPPPAMPSKLEPPPEVAAKPAPVRKVKPKPDPAPVLVETKLQPDKPPVEEIQKTEEKQAIEEKQKETPQIIAEPQQPVIDEVIKENKPAHPLLPRHVQLTFSVYKGKDGFKVGEARHKLEIADNRYNLTATTETTGIASVFKIYRLEQTSVGFLAEQGLAPEHFSEDKTDIQGKHSLSAGFDWGTNTLFFSNGSQTKLPAQTQDALSFLYQFSQMSFNTEILGISVSNGKKLEHYDFVINAEEIIDTRLGPLRAVKLSKMHAEGEEGTEIWLGLDHSLLPVKIRQIDRAGKIAGEMLVSGISVADE